MKYANVNSIKTEAFKGGKGYCIFCNLEVTAKCGEIRIHHWAHKLTLACDNWVENETEWHRNWKNKFPEDWQEIVQYAPSGEKHIADVKTNKNWVLEFQHSYLNSEERNSRNTFYPKLVWIIDGLRRKTDIAQFAKILKDSRQAPVGGLSILKVNFPEESRLLQEWMNSNKPVFFDFGKKANKNFWFLLPLNIKNEAYITYFSREEFITVLNYDGFDELFEEIIPTIQRIINEDKSKISNRELHTFLNRTSSRKYQRRL